MPADPADKKLAAEIMDTIKNIGEHQHSVDCGQLHDWLGQTMWSLAAKECDITVTQIAYAVKVGGYSLRLLEKAWDVTSAGVPRINREPR